MGMGYPGDIELVHGQTIINSRIFAQQLRKSSTEAEQKLWQRIRAKQLGVKFRRQHPFQNFILDFVCLEHRVVVEVDGSQHGENAVKDATRTEVLERAGFRVLRFWNNEVLVETDAVVVSILRALTPSPPQPSP